MPVDELKKLCLEQVEMMSKKRVTRILQGNGKLPYFIVEMTIVLLFKVKQWWIWGICA